MKITPITNILNRIRAEADSYREEWIMSHLKKIKIEEDIITFWYEPEYKDDTERFGKFSVKKWRWIE